MRFPAKTNRAAEYLFRQAEEARKHRARTKEALGDFAELIGATKIAAWEKEYPSEKGEEKNGVLVSRYRADERKRKPHACSRVHG